MNFNNIEIYGHNKQYNILFNAYNNKFPQSWIFNGEEGLGKSMIARKFIFWSIARDYYDPKLLEFESLSQDKRDYIKSKFKACVLEVNNKIEKIDDINSIRKLIDDVALTNFSDFLNKYIIIDNVNSLNLNSKNALLKTIEEPPEKTIIILICHNIKLIPKTILSRCVRLDFNNLNINEFKKYLMANNENLSEEEIKKIYNFSNGRPGYYQAIKKLGGLEILKNVEEIIAKNKLDHLSVKNISDKLDKDSGTLFKMIVNFFYFNCLSLIKITDNREILKNIILFFEFLQKDGESNLNIDKNQILTTIFVNYFKLFKSQ
jgi:DNA polymerase III subunit delta'